MAALGSIKINTISSTTCTMKKTLNSTLYETLLPLFVAKICVMALVEQSKDQQQGQVFNGQEKIEF